MDGELARLGDGIEGPGAVRLEAVGAVGVGIARGPGRRDRDRDAADRHAGDDRAVGAARVVREQIAPDRRRILGHGDRRCRARDGRVVEDADVEARGRGRSVAVGDRHREGFGQRAVGRAAVREAVVDQLVAVADRAADNLARIVIERLEIGDRQNAERGRDRHARESPALEQRLAADGEAGEAIGRREAEAADADQRVAVRRRAIGQIGLRHRHIAALAVEVENRNSVVAAVDGDGQRRGRLVAIAVGDDIGEGLGQRLVAVQPDHRRIVGIDDIAIAAVRREFERAIGALRDAVDLAIGAVERDGRDDRAVAVGAEQIGNAVGGVGIIAADAGQDIAFGILPASRLHRVDIVVRRRDIVDNRDGERRIGCVAVLVADDDVKAVGGVVTIGRRGEQIGIADAGRPEARYGQRAIKALDRLSDPGHRHAVDRDRPNPVGGGNRDRAAGRRAAIPGC